MLRRRRSSPVRHSRQSQLMQSDVRDINVGTRNPSNRLNQPSPRRPQQQPFVIPSWDDAAATRAVNRNAPEYMSRPPIPGGELGAPGPAVEHHSSSSRCKDVIRMYCIVRQLEVLITTADAKACTRHQRVSHVRDEHVVQGPRGRCRKRLT